MRNPIVIWPEFNIRVVVRPLCAEFGVAVEIKVPRWPRPGLALAPGRTRFRWPAKHQSRRSSVPELDHNALGRPAGAKRRHACGPRPERCRCWTSSSILRAGGGASRGPPSWNTGGGQQLFGKPDLIRPCDPPEPLMKLGDFVVERLYAGGPTNLRISRRRHQRRYRSASARRQDRLHPGPSRRDGGFHGGRSRQIHR